MKIIGMILLLVGFILGFVMMLQLESLRINIANKIAQDSIGQHAHSNENAIRLARNIATKSNEVSRIIYLPFIIMIIGGGMLFLGCKNDNEKAKGGSIEIKQPDR